MKIGCGSEICSFSAGVPKMGHMLICRNTEGVHRKRKAAGNL